MSSAGKPKLFLDLDGTLLDIEPKYCGLYRVAGERYGLRLLAPATYWKHRRSGLSERETLLLSNGDSPALGRYLAYWKRSIESRPYLTFDRVSVPRRTLVALAERFDLYVVTMRQGKRNLRWQLKSLGLTGYLSGVACRADLAARASRSSSDVAVKAALVRRFKPSAGRDVIVGDTELEASVGEELGLEAALVSSGIRTRAILLSASRSGAKVFASLTGAARHLLAH